MSPKGRRFQRPLGVRRYRKLFVIAVEGVVTEPQYFALFDDQQSVIHVNCLKGGHDSSPPQVLQRMENHLKQAGLKSSDEAWLVVDKDQWTDAQLGTLYTWAGGHKNYDVALSNPQFEYWLLLHFEDGTGIASALDCTNRLKRHLPGYNKGIDVRKINREQIDEAIRRARQRDTPPCVDWPRALGGTTVYKLVENILRTGL
ncbi:MAG: RloB domain-containing protein [Magnetococcales bacterium]|nr:RloB domain-containing protein [Magnetococcales bacterium]